MERNATNRRLLSLLLAFVLCLSYGPAARAESTTAAVMRLMKTEGTVSIANSSGRSVKQTERMQLRSGYQLTTKESSYAWINLDDEKLVKMDAVSEITVRKSGKKLDILLDAGNLFFNVKSPLDDDEVFNIRTSTMSVGIRGTSGWVKVIDQWTSRLSVLEGTVAVCVTDPVTGEIKTESVTSGETVDCKVYPQDTSGSKCSIIRGAYGESDIDGFVLVELRPDASLCEKIKEETGIDIIGMPGKPADRLKQDQEQIRDKLQEIENSLARQEEAISIDKVWPAPAPDAPGTPATPPAASNPDSGGSNSGGSSGNGSGGSSGGGSEQPTPSRTVTLTMPVEDDTVSACLTQSGITAVVLQPGAARSSSANMLEVDSGITVPGGKTLTLQSGVGMTILSGQQVAVGTGGRLTVGGVLTARGTLAPVQNAVIQAKRFDLTSDIPDWIVSGTADSSGYYALEYSPWEAFTVTFDVNGGSASPAAGKTDSRGRLTSLPSPGTRTGYVFDGWYTAAEGGSAVDANHVYTGDTTLYAHWSQIPPETFTVAFNANGGSVSPTSGVTGEDGKLSSLPTPVREGFTFDGWFTAAEGGTAVDLNRVYTGNTTLYAHWSEIPPETFTVVFDANGGSVSPGSGVTGADGKLSSLPTPVREGYNFNGWFTAAEGGTAVDLNRVYTGDTTLYAHWTETPPETFTVTFDANGGSVSPGSGVTGEDGTLSSLPTPTRSGYTFDGWFTAATGGTRVDVNDVYSSDTTIYAHWSQIPPKTFTVTFDANGGSVSPGSGVTGEDGTLSSLPTLADWKQQASTYSELTHTFVGWYTQKIGGTKVTADTVFTEDTTIYAGWDWFYDESTKTLCIAGSGPMKDYVYEYQGSAVGWECTIPWMYTEDGFNMSHFDIDEIYITDGITHIGNSAFKGHGAKHVTIPNSVTSIGDKSFMQCNMTNVTIPASVTSIGSSAFESCSGLTSVTLPDSVTGIGAEAFYGCNRLTEVTYGGTRAEWAALVPNISANNDPLLNATITCTDGVYTAPQAYTITFDANGGSVTPASAETGKDGKLTSLPTPIRNNHIFDGWYSAAEGGTRVDVNDVYTSDTTIYAHWTIDGVIWSVNNGILTISGKGTMESIEGYGDFNFNTPWDADKENITQVVMNEGLTTIGAFAFSGLKLTSVSIPASVINIDWYGFYTCKELESVIIPNSVKSISKSTFEFCSSLKSVSLPNSVTDIGQYIFAKCTNLESVTISNSITSLSKSAFEACSNLKSVSIPNGVTTIEQGVFKNCTGLTSVTIPTSVTSIGAEAFYGCNRLTDVTYNGTRAEWAALVPNIGASNDPLHNATITCTDGVYGTHTLTLNADGGLITIEGQSVGEYSIVTGKDGILPDLPEATKADNVFGGWYTADGTKLSAGDMLTKDTEASVHWYPGGEFWYYDTDAKTLHVTAELTGGVNNAPWKDYRSEMERVEIGGSVATIDGQMFRNYPKLRSVVISDSVTTITSWVFADCSALTALELPRSITIDVAAFQNCTNLAEVKYDGAIADWLALVPFIGDDNGSLLSATIHCSNGDYTATQYTITFNAQGGMFVLDGVEASVFSAIAISGRPLDSLPTARRDGYTFDGWYTSAGEDGTEVTKDTIFIEDTTLYAHWTANVQSNFDVASGTLTISGEGPMEAIDGYNTTLPWNDVKTDIIKVVIADGVTSIGNTAFQGCTGLAEVEIPASVTSIGTDAFALCNNLDNVYYGGSQEAWNTAVGGRDSGLNAQCAVHYESAGPDNPSSRSAYRVSNAASVYTDVPAGAWYAEAAEYCRTHNLMTGTSATTFTPDGTLTRAMMVTVLHRLAGKPAAPKGSSFADVPSGKWYTEAISWADSKGIVKGYNASTFGLNDPVTHEQVGLILQRYSGDPTVEAYGKENPKSPATRGEIAATLMAYAESRKAGSLSAASAMDVMCSPGSIVPMGDGSYLVADRYNKQLWRVQNRTSASYAGGPTTLDLYGKPLGGYNDGGLQESYFKEPWAIAPFLDGWAVTDRANNAVRLIRSEAIRTLNTASAEKLTVTDLGVVFDGPTGLAADGGGNLYVADTLNGAVRRVSVAGGLSTVVQGLSDPMGLCWQDGVLYIAETGKNRILQLKDGKVTVLAGSGSEGLTDGKGTKAAFSAPQGIAVGTDGSVYVADTGNGAVRVVKDGSVRTLAVRDPAQLSGEMISPAGLLLQENSLYICDTFARKIFVLPVQT